MPRPWFFLVFLFCSGLAPGLQADSWWEQQRLEDVKQKKIVLLDSKKIPRKNEETYAFLLLSSEQCSDFYIHAFIRLLKQYRPKKPHPWESFWLFWDFHWLKDTEASETSGGDRGVQKETQYLLIKPEGWEWGRAFGEREQEFYATYSGARWSIFSGLNVRFSKWGNMMSLKINGHEWSWRYPMSKTARHLGFYVEDAKVLLRLRDYACSM